MTCPTISEMKVAGEPLCEICGRPSSLCDFHLIGANLYVIRCGDEPDCGEGSA